MRTKLSFKCILLASAAGLSAISAETFTLLHTFTGDGNYPSGALIETNGTLYGMGHGGVFKLSTDGSAFTSLHYFSQYGGNGNNPRASLVLSGTNLYGMTVEGGMGVGVVFRISTDGRGYTNLHVFSGSTTNGSMPYGSLTLANGKLFGSAHLGGGSNFGALFVMNIDGSGYTNIHSFAGGVDDGAYPMGDLLLSGANLYGTTSQGGAANLGTVFRLNPDGSGYTNLHSFAGYPTDGSGPAASLTLDGSTLYGMTQAGGSAAPKLGTVFKLNTDGTGSAILHSFAGSGTDGSTPLGSLTLANGMLYGMTSAGGASNYGVVFRLAKDGSNYTNVHVFSASATNGATPYGSLILAGKTLYGMTYYGGVSNRGVIFALSGLPPEPPTSLQIESIHDSVVVSWPASVLGCTLQTNNDLGKVGTWRDYTGLVISNSVSDVAKTGKLFFRLRYP